MLSQIKNLPKRSGYSCNKLSHRNYFEVGRERLLPHDEEGVGEVEAEEDDAAGRGRDVGAREERRYEEAEHDGAHLERW